ncbi:MAG: DUF4190 domain-containing protein [Phycisphaerales bacterium]|nr:DUF4190 domain-containing protein [Phycisphaerales bacterium]
MSQFDPPASDFDRLDTHDARPQRNPAGIVGFVLALLCVTSPLGLLVSLFALTKRPKGFAIAGTITGLIFTVLLVLGIVGFRMMWPAFMGVGSFVETQKRVSTYQANNNGQVPPDLQSIGLPAELTNDPWGTPWSYAPSADGTSFTLTSAGPDKTMGNADDIALSSDMTDDQVGETIMRAWMESK